MSLDKAIEHGKERRKPYRRSRAFDRTCRNHGSCSWCEGNRTYAARKTSQLTPDDVLDGWDVWNDDNAWWYGDVIL